MKPELRQAIDRIASRYPERRSALLPAFNLAQREAGGCVGGEDLAAIADLVGVPVAEAFGVQTYYSMLEREPRGRFHLEVDTNIPAMLAGAEALVAHLEQRLGIRVGETTADGLFTLSEVEDLGACGTCPVIQVGDRYFERMTPAKADALLASLRQGVVPEVKPELAVGGDRRVLLRRAGNPDPASLAAYAADGGYQALAKALGMAPGEIIAEVKSANLRGRGGAGFPTGLKWEFLAKGTGKPTYLVCNADEGEPGTFKDRQIMERDPHLLIEGMLIAGYAIGAKLGFIYIRGEFSWIADLLEEAIEQARAAGRLGTRILGRDFDFDIIVHRGAGAYVCGEETALIESLEGKRGNPRMRPPFPAVAGLYGCPTIVNNVETLALVPFIVCEGAAAFRGIGTPNNFGPKLFGVSGHVGSPGVFELPLGTPLGRVLEAAGGVKGELKAVIPGGLSTPLLTAAELKSADLPMDYDACIKRGTMLGSGGIIVMNETARIPEIAWRTIRFYAHESCGQCTPCREGSRVIEELLAGLVAGRGTRRDIETVLGLAAAIKGTTLCPTGDAFANPIEAMVLKFREEFEALVR